MRADRDGRFTDAGSVSLAVIQATEIGMAHFAGSGPDGATCAGCKFLERMPRMRKPICTKYRDMTGEGKRGISGEARACRHFQKK